MCFTSAASTLHRSTNLGASFEVLSPDLTRNDPDKLKPSGGPITRDNTGAEVYCNIFASSGIATGTRPALGGHGRWAWRISRAMAAHTWQEITPPDLPEWALISIIDLSPNIEAGAAYSGGDALQTR